MRKKYYTVLLIVMIVGAMLHFDEGMAVGMEATAAATSTLSTDYLQMGFELMKKETVGLLGIGLDTASVLQRLGEPEEKEPPSVWGADGLEHQRWYYRARGIQLGMVRGVSGQTIERFTVKDPCDFKTKRGIGIGSTEQEVRGAYQAELNAKDSTENQLVAGSIYGGIIFRLQEGVVTSIFIGAAAE